jgi:S-adenosylmethionine:tRNA ribosyltransferase-isomerase
MFTAPYTYHLPPEKIAHRAAEPRDSAKLLHYAGGNIEDRVFRDLPELLRAGDLLVLNDSKVIPARLYLQRAGRVDAVRGGAAGSDVDVELLLHQAKGTDLLEWTAFAKPAKRLKVGDRLWVAGDAARREVVEIVGHGGMQVEVRFLLPTGEIEGFLQTLGHTPLPPYIEARDDAETRARYQTVFAAADKPGSVAAPTAGLHFTPELLDQLRSRGVDTARVTLHVGAGTFLNPTPEQIAAKKLHAEFAHMTPEVAAKILDTKTRGGRVIPVGTTALRTLESWAQMTGMSAEGMAAETTIFIQPGYRFEVADCLMTNFHLPDSSLLMLVSAFIGIEEMQRVYGHALSHPYRFYSFGDTSLLEPRP